MISSGFRGEALVPAPCCGVPGPWRGRQSLYASPAPLPAPRPPPPASLSGTCGKSDNFEINHDNLTGRLWGNLCEEGRYQHHFGHHAELSCTISFCLNAHLARYGSRLGRGVRLCQRLVRHRQLRFQVPVCV